MDLVRVNYLAHSKCNLNMNCLLFVFLHSSQIDSDEEPIKKQ